MRYIVYYKIYILLKLFLLGSSMRIFLLFLLTSYIFGQTYSEGDYVENFGAEICYNGEGTWEWEVEGLNKVTWISSFATW